MATSTKWQGNQTLILKMLGSNPTVVTTAELQKPRANKYWAGKLEVAPSIEGNKNCGDRTTRDCLMVVKSNSRQDSITSQSLHFDL